MGNYLVDVPTSQHYLVMDRSAMVGRLWIDVNPEALLALPSLEELTVHPELLDAAEEMADGAGSLGVKRNRLQNLVGRLCIMIEAASRLEVKFNKWKAFHKTPNKDGLGGEVD